VVRLDFPGATGERETLCFADPVEVVVAEAAGEVRGALREVERAASRGRYVVGYLSYEAAPAFDPAYAVRPGCRLPLAWFGLFDAPLRECGAPESRSLASPVEWEPTTSRAAYDAAITELQGAFARGELAQANYTLRLRALLDGDALTLYHRLLAAQGRGAYGAYLDLGRFRILSASPELFFRRTGDRLMVRPMKGTARRGLWVEDDDARAALLARSSKDRAENLMTAEWMRGELERIARPGTVELAEPCAVERYPTVFQLTTTLGATLRPEVSLEGIFAELFPAVSVTGVPRLPAMRRIAELEMAPREVYCGAIGVVRPGGDAVFNVAIRTLWLDTVTGVAEYGVGGGITAASTAAGEYDEVRAKSVVLTRAAPSFELLETLRLSDGEYVRLERHLGRLGASARYFGREDPTAAARTALAEHARQWPVGVRRVRLLVEERGSVRVESEAFTNSDDGTPAGLGGLPGAAATAAPLPVRLARTPISRDDPFLYHKTTHRQVHESRRAEWPDAFDVLLWNEAGELTEFTRGNLVVELDGIRWTPPREGGLLAGTFRAELLEHGEIRERVLRAEDLGCASGVWLINSLREWVPVSVLLP
jgi:para-aminobenzoate synthetase/4-amino-4-deoxychorismate lyase